MASITLYRAAKDDVVVGCASFATSREDAEVYRNNPGFGGPNLYRAEVEIDEDTLLDLTDVDDPIEAVMELTGLSHPGAIGVDEWVPRISYELREAGIEWVIVPESYPTETQTYIFVGTDDPDMELIED